MRTHLSPAPGHDPAKGAGPGCHEAAGIARRQEMASSGGPDEPVTILKRAVSTGDGEEHTEPEGWAPGWSMRPRSTLPRSC
jgi:hypothetical protein